MGTLCNILHNDTSNVYLHRDDLPVCLIKHCACSRTQRALLAHTQGVNTPADKQENSSCVCVRSINPYNIVCCGCIFVVMKSVYLILRFRHFSFGFRLLKYRKVAELEG